MLAAVVEDHNHLQATVNGVLQRAEGIKHDVGQAQQLVKAMATIAGNNSLLKYILNANPQASIGAGT